MASNTSRPEGLRKIGSTAEDSTNRLSVLDYFNLDRGVATFRGIEGGSGITVSLVDADGSPSTTGKIIRITGSGTGGSGAPGALWFADAGAPTGALGAEGDMYLDSVSGDFYQKGPISWTLKGNLKGPTGAAGADGNDGTDGIDGASAYEIAVDNGFVGTEIQWLASLVGPQGPAGPAGADGVDGVDGAQGPQGEPGPQGIQGEPGPQGPQGEPGPQGPIGPAGADGTSFSVKGSRDTVGELPTTGNVNGDAYLVAGDLYVWNDTQFDNAGPLQGPKGDKGDTGDTGPAGPAGADGTDGASAYEIAVAGGFVGTEAAWLASLVGPQGPAGPAGADGTDGASAYEIAVAGGFVGTEAAWLASLVGPAGAPGTNGTNGTDGTDGESAYEIAVAAGFIGTEADWLASLVGPKGDKGDPGTDGVDGTGVPVGGTTGQLLAKIDGTDYNTEWVDAPSGSFTGIVSDNTSTTVTSGNGTAGSSFAVDVRISGTAGNALTVDGVNGLYVAPVAVQDSGVTVQANPTAINFTGAGVTVTNVSGVATVDIPAASGGGSSITPYTFKVIFNAQSNVDSITDLPAGWTGTVTGNNSISITHPNNIGSAFYHGFYGQTGAGSTTLQFRPATASSELEYDSATNAGFIMNGISAAVTGSVTATAGAYTIVKLLFV